MFNFLIPRSKTQIDLILISWEEIKALRCVISNSDDVIHYRNDDKSMASDRLVFLSSSSYGSSISQDSQAHNLSNLNPVPNHCIRTI